MKQKFTLSWLALTMTLLLFGGGIKSWSYTYTIGWGTASGSNSTNFTTASGSVDGILSFSTDKGSSSSVPAYNSGSKELRLYYHSSGNGGSITISPASGYIITGAVISATSSYTPTVKYSADDGTATAASLSGTTYTISNIKAGKTLKIQNANTTNTQLRIKTIEITYKKATTLTLSPSSGTLVKGGSDLTITPTVSYTVGTVSSPTITWQTSNSKVATVTDGVVHAVAEGTATITAKYAGDDTYAAATDATCTITVEDIPSYTITAESNNTDLGTVELVGSKITATPASNCRLTSSPYTVTEGTATVDQDGNVFTVTPSTNCTVRINFEAIPSHTATFSVNGIESSTDFREGEAITFPSNPADVNFKKFMGWYGDTYSNASTAPTYVNTATETMGTANKTYYAVFADETTVEGDVYITLNNSTKYFPTSYGDANTFTEYTLEGNTFMIQQGYINGTKLQWRSSDHDNGAGTIYNSGKINKIQSIVLNYDASDTKKNFTLNIGSSANPTSGTSITPDVDEDDLKIYTFDCSSYNYDYFVLTNGVNAGYLTSLTINYRGPVDGFANFCTTVPAAAITYDESSTTAPVLCAQANVTLTRTLSASYWNTFAVPFDAAIPTGWTVKQFKSESDGTMEFEDATTLEAGKPYLVKPTSNAVNPTFSNVSITATDGATMGSSLTFTGLLCQKSYDDLGPNPAYLATNGTVKKLTSGSMKGMRAYFNVPSNNSKLNIVIDGVSLGIDQIDGGQLSNGNAKVYNLNGQEVKVPRRGIYIHNGKKVVKQ